MSLASDKEDGIQLGFAPSFDVKATLSLDSIIDENSEDTPPEWLLNETFQATIDGAAMPSILLMDLLGDSDESEPLTPPSGGEGGEGGEGGTPLPPGEPEEESGQTLPQALREAREFRLRRLRRLRRRREE